LEHSAFQILEHDHKETRMTCPAKPVGVDLIERKKPQS